MMTVTVVVLTGLKKWTAELVEHKVHNRGLALTSRASCNVNLRILHHIYIAIHD